VVDATVMNSFACAGIDKSKASTTAAIKPMAVLL
jgi:hypothetical protein